MTTHLFPLFLKLALIAFKDFSISLSLYVVPISDEISDAAIVILLFLSGVFFEADPL